MWTTLHDFGGTDGLKGNLGQINQIPFDRPTAGDVNNVWGTGFTPEGIDQNPVYYDFMLEASWRSAPVTNITDYVVRRQHARYGLVEPNADVTSAWTLLVRSAYAQDLSVQDGTGVPHLGANEGYVSLLSSMFHAVRCVTSSRLFCCRLIFGCSVGRWRSALLISFHVCENFEKVLPEVHGISFIHAHSCHCRHCVAFFTHCDSHFDVCV